jgi:hypothetical protein
MVPTIKGLDPKGCLLRADDHELNCSKFNKAVFLTFLEDGGREMTIWIDRKDKALLRTFEDICEFMKND